MGTVFPIEFFPGVLQHVFAYSPVYAICYGPAKLFVDFSWNNAACVITSQILYLLVAYVMCAALYKKGVRKLNVNGG